VGAVIIVNGAQELFMKAMGANVMFFRAKTKLIAIAVVAMIILGLLLKVFGLGTENTNENAAESAGSGNILSDTILSNIFTVTIGNERYNPNITELDLRGKQLTSDDIEQLSSMTNLTALGLNNNKISDLVPLSGLTNLKILYFKGNNISDLTPIIELKNLESLSFINNRITDLTPLKGLRKLTELYSDGNNISDLTALAGLSNLKEIEIEDNPISDWSPVNHVAEVKGRPKEAYVEKFGVNETGNEYTSDDDSIGNAAGNKYQGEILYKGLPLSRYLDYSIEKVIEAFGNPSYYNDYDEYLYEFEDIMFSYNGETRQIFKINIYGNLNIVEIDGVKLNKSRTELIGIFGKPSSEYWDAGQYFIIYKRPDYSFGFIQDDPDLEAYQLFIWKEDDGAEDSNGINNINEWKESLKKFMMGFPSLFDDGKSWEEYELNGTPPIGAMGDYVPCGINFYDLDNDNIPEVWVVYAVPASDVAFFIIYKLYGDKYEELFTNININPQHIQNTAK
jgi:Leucine-rich repeat (LRR) protein